MDFDVLVVGAGPGGYIAAIRASQLGLKTCVVEQSSALGGTCLNVGCIPSKTLLHSSELYARFSEEVRARNLPLANHAFDFPALMSHKTKIVEGLTDAIDAIFKKHKIEVITGLATLSGPHAVVVDGKTVTAKAIILASGSEPIGLPFLPFDEKRIVSSTGALSLEKIPKRLLVVGGGVIGVELASVYSRLGADVTIIEMLPQICTGIDSALTSLLYSLLQKQKLKFHLHAQVLAGQDRQQEGISLEVRQADGNVITCVGDVVLVAIGRKARSQDLGVTNLNIDTTPRGAIVVDKEFRTTVPSIYAIGDLIDGPMLAHRASYEGVAVSEIIAGKHPSLDYMTIPNVVYTSPELATVGFSEDEAKEVKRPLKIGKCAFRGNPRARTADDLDGLVKVVADAKTERLLGMHILASCAAEMIEIGVLGISKRVTLSDIGDLPFAHPTYSEAIKEACLQALGRSYHL